MDQTVHDINSSSNDGQNVKHLQPLLPFELQLQILLSSIPTETTFDVYLPNVVIDDRDDVDAALATVESTPNHVLVIPTRPQSNPPVPTHSADQNRFRPPMYQPTIRPKPDTFFSLLLVHPSFTPHLLRHLYSTSDNIFHFANFATLAHFHRTIPPSMVPLVRRISIDACGPPSTAAFIFIPTLGQPHVQYFTQCFSRAHPDLRTIPTLFRGLHELHLPGIRPYTLRHQWRPPRDADTTTTPGEWTSPEHYEYTRGVALAGCTWRPDMITLLIELVRGPADSCLRDATILCARDHGTRLVRRPDTPLDLPYMRPDLTRETEVDLATEVREWREVRDRMTALWQNGVRFVEW